MSYESRAANLLKHVIKHKAFYTFYLIHTIIMLISFFYYYNEWVVYKPYPQPFANVQPTFVFYTIFYLVAYMIFASINRALFISIYTINLFFMIAFIILGYFNIDSTVNLIYFLQLSFTTKVMGNYLMPILLGVGVFLAITVALIVAFYRYPQPSFFFSQKKKYGFSAFFVFLILSTYCINPPKFDEMTEKMTYLNKYIVPVKTDIGLFRAVRLVRYLNLNSKLANPYQPESKPVNLSIDKKKQV